ncbi:type II secretion system protein GspL [Alteromonas sediminis]|uniref:Type II secretion system protein L n=1 Tax=Alteromonas sediminis TaxID=2259342 RepID=A0A3N5Y7D9_9ALTE|nr:type II secretion system protein GspL [Alteromonas sediminis]RPJ66689.1 type II secretion system protein GspL [Alteromonas sediminis]
MEQLIVRLNSDDKTPVSWLVWSSSESDVIASGVLPDASHLNTLKERAGQRAIIALVPGSDVLLKWVTLPPKANRKVINAIPFMLEDELSEDIADLFFATGPRHGDRQAVAIVKHDKVRLWQAQLDAAGLYCEQLLPDVLAVPHHQDGMSLLTLSDQVLVREDEWKGFQGEADWVVPALAHATKQSETKVVINNYSDLSLHDVPNTEVVSQTLELPMAVLAKHALSASFNLFQNEYKVRKKSSSTLWTQWRLAAGLAALALVLTLVDKTLTLYSLEERNSVLKAQIDTQVNAGFPNMGAYRDLRRKVSSELAKLEQSGGGSSMLVMMSQLQPAFALSKVKPQLLRFDQGRGELRIQALASNFEALEQFKNQAEQSGFIVEQGAINNRPEGVVGSLSIRSGA